MKVSTNRCVNSFRLQRIILTDVAKVIYHNFIISKEMFGFNNWAAFYKPQSTFPYNYIPSVSDSTIWKS